LPQANACGTYLSSLVIEQDKAFFQWNEERGDLAELDFWLCGEDEDFGGACFRRASSTLAGVRPVDVGRRRLAVAMTASLAALGAVFAGWYASQIS